RSLVGQLALREQVIDGGPQVLSTRTPPRKVLLIPAGEALEPLAHIAPGLVPSLLGGRVTLGREVLQRPAELIDLADLTTHRQGQHHPQRPGVVIGEVLEHVPLLRSASAWGLTAPTGRARDSNGASESTSTPHILHAYDQRANDPRLSGLVSVLALSCE